MKRKERKFMSNKMEFTCLDSANNKLDIYETVHFINEDNKIETGTIMALLRENEVLLETSEEGNYIFRNAEEIAKVFILEKEKIAIETSPKKQKEMISKLEEISDKETEEVEVEEESEDESEDETEKELEEQLEEETEAEKALEEEINKKAEEWLLENYETTTLSQKEIGEKFNKKRYEIANLVRKLNLKKKSQ